MNENIRAYAELKANELEKKKEILATNMRREAMAIQHYSSNFIMALSRDLAVYAVEIARLEGEMNVLNQLLGSEEE